MPRLCAYRLSQGVADMSIGSLDTTANTTANAVTELTAAAALNSSVTVSTDDAASHDAMSVVQPVVAGMAT
jgi:VCBS repeat-containing protein